MDRGTLVVGCPVYWTYMLWYVIIQEPIGNLKQARPVDKPFSLASMLGCKQDLTPAELLLTYSHSGGWRT
jgi:hypothetical protein